MVGMVDSRVLSRAELQRLAERIAAVQQSAPAIEITNKEAES